jgi:hypothetical protein
LRKERGISRHATGVSRELWHAAANLATRYADQSSQDLPIC